MKPTYIGRLYLENYKCFKGEQELSFLDEAGKLYQWTIILGNNNTGKTNVLKALAMLNEGIHFDDVDKKDYSVPIGYWRKLDNEAFVSSSLLYTENKNRDLWSLNFEIEDGILWEYGKEMGTAIPATVMFDFIIYAYGVSRRNSRKPITAEAAQDNAISLFGDNDGFINIEDWLSQIYLATKSDKISTKEKAEKRLQQIKELVVSDIFPDIEDFRFETDENLRNYVEFKTPNGWFQLEELGYGYQSAMSWIIDLSKKMIERYPDSPNPLKEPAVVLVDEIDMHLHPSWQKRIVGYLSDHFTATQFIVTTHSPMILQALERVNLYILRKNGVGVNIEAVDTDNFQGWELAEIVGELMEAPTESDLYKKLRKEFDEGLDEDNYEKAKKAYDRLMKILHPSNVERKLLSIQLSQVTPEKLTDALVGRG